MKKYIIETFGLSRRFGNVTAVDQLNLQVPAEGVYGFLGPNGAGKTTTIRMLLGLIHPSAGNIQILDKPFQTNKKIILSRVGSLVETPSLYPHLSGYENLLLIQKMVEGKKEEIERVLRLVDMWGDAHRLVKEYSLGMRQRLALAMAMLNHPRLLILDEPTNGLDPAGIYEIRQLIKSLAGQQEATIFISSHLLREVEQTASYIGIVLQGRLVFQGTPQQLGSRYQDKVNILTDRQAEAREFLTQEGWKVTADEQQYLDVKINNQKDAALINSRLMQAGFNVCHLALKQPSLEEIFLQMTQENK